MISRISCYGRYRILCPWSFVAATVISALGVITSSHAGTVTFGSGKLEFTMEFVTIGDPGNTADTTGVPNSAGSVGYEYGIGKFEVSEEMIELYNLGYGNDNGLTITADTRGNQSPATSVSWNEAARFVNWLNTSTGGHAAYKYTTSGVNDNIQLWTAADTLDYDSANPYRSKRATYVLPNYDEWYKAAYYSRSGTYYDFPTGSDTAPDPVANGTAPNTAVFGGGLVTGPADVENAGGLSDYGVMGLGGNVFEWQENSFDPLNIIGSSSRGVRGGSWTSDSSVLSSSTFLGINPMFEFEEIGFRVVSLSSSTPPSGEVPEPSMMVIGTLFGLGGLMAKRRMKK